METYCEILDEKILHEENAFELRASSRLGGTTISMGQFVDRATGEHWLGKSDIGQRINNSLYAACWERIANDIYAYYGVTVARLRISKQRIEMDQANRKALFPGRTHAYYLFSRWFDRFSPYNYLPRFAARVTEAFHIQVDGRALPERGLGQILAISDWINDIDVIGGSGGNVGYQLRMDADGRLYAHSCKIDPGYAFFRFENNVTRKVTSRLQLATQAEGRYVQLDDLPSQTQQEYFATLRLIANTPDASIHRFFYREGLTCLDQHPHRNRERTLKILLGRRKGLLQLHAERLHAFTDDISEQSVERSSIPLILQRLYTTAHWHYIRYTREDAEYHIPLDTTLRPGSDQRTLLEKTLKTFLSDPEQKTLLLLGDAGAGKSLAMQLLEHKRWKVFKKEPAQFVPLRIELKRFTGTTVRRCIENTLLDNYHYSREMIRRLQREYRFLFGFDGYDEIGGRAKVKLYEQLASDWPGSKCIITCRTEYYKASARADYIPSTGSSIYYVAPLILEQTLDYLEQYRAHRHDLELPDYGSYIKSHPHLQTLLGNPFLLRIFRDAFPQLLDDHPEMDIEQLTRYQLYTAFMDHWFASATVRQSVQMGQWLPDDVEKVFVVFAQSLAFEMHCKGVDEITNSDDAIWWSFFNEQNEMVVSARAACPLRLGDGHRYSFVHKSFLEYFVATYLLKALRDEETLRSFSHRLLSEEPAVLRFIVEGLKLESDYEGLSQRLLHAIHASRRYPEHSMAAANAMPLFNRVSSMMTDLNRHFSDFLQVSRGHPKRRIAAANAISLLNTAGRAFTGEYGGLQGVDISGADLSHVLLDHANLQGANLQNVTLHNAVLRKADLRGADLRGARFGQLPYLRFKYSIDCITYSPNGQWLAIIAGGNIELWEVHPYRQVEVLSEHWYSSVAFSENSCRMALGSYSTMILWSVTERREVARLWGHTHGVMSVAFSADGHWLVSGNLDYTVCLWSVTKRGEVAVLSGHTGPVISVAFSADGHWLASGSYDHTVRLWSVAEQCEVAVLSGHTNWVSSVTFSADSLWLASGSDDHTVRLWSVAERCEVAVLSEHTEKVSSVAFSADGQWLASGSDDRTVRLWSVAERCEVAVLSGHTGRVTSVAFIADSLWLASGSGDHTVRLWSVTERREVAGHTSSVISVAFSADGQWLASGSKDKTVRLWSLAKRCEVALLSGHTDWVSSVAFSADGQWLASGSYDHTVRLWSVKERRVMTVLSGYTRGASSVAFSADGQWLALVSRGWDHTVRLWSVAEQCEAAVLSGHTQPKSVAFSADSRWLASGSGDHTVRLWAMKERREVAVLFGHTGWVISVTFSADGQWLASGSWDKTVRLWSVKDWHEVAVLSGHTKEITSVAFSADGQWLASGGMDHTVRLWSVAERCEVAVLSGHTDHVYSVAFNCDGLLASAGDKAICVWAPITSGTHHAWQLIWRISRYPTFVASGAFIQNAQLSEENKQLLLQYGATADAAPVYGNNPHTFWRRRRLVSSQTQAGVALQAPAPAQVCEPLSQADFVQAVRDCVQTLQTRLSADYDADAAASFTATWLRAVRKSTLETLQQQPEDHGIPEAVMGFFNDYAPQHRALYGGQTLPDYSRRLEETMNRGEFVPIEFNAQDELIDIPSQRKECLVM